MSSATCKYVLHEYTFPINYVDTKYNNNMLNVLRRCNIHVLLEYVLTKMYIT